MARPVCISTRSAPRHSGRVFCREKRKPVSKADPRSSGASLNADIGDEGELWFAAQLPRGWVWQPPRRDLGKDGLIVVRDNSDLHNLEFAVQVKSSVQPTVHDGHIIKAGVSRSSVLYWFASPLPTLVVAVDVTQRLGWFAWHLDLFRSPADVFDAEAETLTIRIPERNQLNDAGWSLIRCHLKEHFSSLQAALTDARLTSRLMAGLNLISTAVGNLVRLSSCPPPDGQPDNREGISILIEQIEHRNILTTVRTLLRRIRPESGAHKQIRFWIESYEATVLRAFPRFSELPSNNSFPPDLELAFAPKVVMETRSRLIEAGIDMIRLLTRRNVEDEAEQGAAPKSRPPSQLPTSPGVQTPDSLRTPSSGGCG